MKPSIGSVLYIEDDKDTRELVTLLLEQSGYELVAAENYDEALLLARTNRFDLYLIDHRMSRGSGRKMGSRTTTASLSLFTDLQKKD